MKFAIISDTHSNVANFQKIVHWLNQEKITAILHCGDIGDPESLEESLKDFKGELFGVFGNMDSDYQIRIDEYNKIPQVEIIEDTFEKEIDGKKVAFVHFPDIARRLAESGNYDLVFYGHTHRPWEETVLVRPKPNGEGGGRCRLVNPGEAAGQRYKPTFAIYNTETDALELKILELL